MWFKNIPAMNIEIVALWNVAPCFLVLCYQRFKDKCWRSRQQILPKFWYIATKISKKIAEDADSSISKILVHCHKCFKGKCWRYRQQILPKFWYIVTNVSKEISEGIGRIFKGKCWRCRQQILPKFWYIATNVPKENSEGISRRVFQNSGT